MLSDDVIATGTGATEAEAAEPAPRWLTRLAATSGGLALLALGVGLWAKWGVVLAMSEDFLKACF